MRLSTVIAAGAAFVVAGVAGAATAWIGTGPGGWVPNAIRINAWTTSTVIGSQSADAWTRAYVSRIGLLGLPRSESAYYSAYVDDSGQPLETTASYEIRGVMPEGPQWWSVTAYGPDSFLMDVPNDHFSVSSATEGVDDGRIVVSAERPSDGAPWVELTGDQTFSLTLRFYRHPNWTDEELRNLDLPQLVRVSP